MPQIKAFRALLYSDKMKSQLGSLVSPPYDVISPEQFENLKKLNPYQSVQLALVQNPEDPDRYKKMSALFQRWKAEKILTAYEQDAFYLIEDTFTTGQEKHTRVGFVGLLEVSPFEKKEILPHEHTLSGPKKDRLELLKSMRAEISQIFLCYRDPALVLEGIYKAHQTLPPLFDAVDTTKVRRRVWTLTKPEEIKKLTELVQNGPALIADGHHRYETALAYSKEAQQKYVQVYLTNLNSPGFSIQPIHRLFSLPTNLPREDFFKSIAKSFAIQEYSKEISVDALLLEKKLGDLKIFVCDSNGKNYLLTQKRKEKKEAEIFSIHRDIFEAVLHWNVKELAKGTIHYEHETQDFFTRLKTIKNGIGLFLPPTDISLVMDLATLGERMPQKSTFFYPKLASGLINYDLDF